MIIFLFLAALTTTVVVSNNSHPNPKEPVVSENRINNASEGASSRH